MGYYIEERDGIFEVMEESRYEPYRMGRCDTRERAERFCKEWQARDDLHDDISEFEDNMFDKYRGILSEKVIRERIQEYIQEYDEEYDE